jgi:hypothetical protein
MGLSFLAPAFLLGLAALAVPILVHLTQRQRKDVVEFPSLMFLERIPYRSVRRQRIRHWLLFLIRCLAIVLLAAAFSRPFLDRPDPPLALGATAREVVILVDRSYSMGYGERWAEAGAAVRRVVGELGPEDRATLIAFDEAAVEVVPATTDRGRILAALDTLAVGSRTTRYAPALQLAGRILAASQRPRREAVLVSDLQRRGWGAAEGAKLPAGAALVPVVVGAGDDAGNAMVAAVTFRREPDGRAERVTATARVVNGGDSPVHGLAVALELEGREVQSRRVDVEARGAASVVFDPFILAGGGTWGTVRIARDALPADDAHHFTLAPGQAIPVLILEGPEPGASLYLRQALSIGEATGFRVETRPAGWFRTSELDDKAVVVLNDAPFPTGGTGLRLREWVEEGGGLIVALGEASRVTDDAAALLPGRFGPPVDREGGALGRIDYGHPIFEPFASPRSGDLTAARFYRTRLVEPAESARVLARFDDGAPALVERRHGRGRVLLWASSFDAFWNDLALQPVFLPFVHRLARHAAGHAESRPSYTVGQALDVDGLSEKGRAQATATGAMVVRTPSGRRIEVGAGGAEGADAAEAADGGTATEAGGRAGGTGGGAARLIELAEQGFYEIREGERGDGAARVVAVNLDLAESDLARLDAEELVAAATTPGTAATAEETAELGPAERERQQRWWWYLLAGALGLLAVEPVLANRLSRAGA